ncbi:PspC domain-containing protein [Roseateles oligotrophus]|uniref:PspC domain-containing protein n=1 Tax=Roseateles oligotrophus TaxID=1769250 RepID=A0ABT2YL09_9BURK|nr:PspC domain-containing protein [Roseateles oligotrophus]MCV2370731.1 PspC domain-containing protein [Roseateles oligotrophus]
MSDSTELEKLAELQQRGVLTAEEFARAKERLLGGAAAGPAGSQHRPAYSSSAGGINELRRSRDDRWIGGVCGGIAKLTGIESWLCRLLLTVLALFAGSGVLVYILLWIFVPEED